ncbi:uncharacterized protein UBRO_00393 [Ustilago bromivora]|uniref:Expansin-like EG45 domain-containing protein n=1 Tax=Ustilago bromivora TaxID=307758 RepID=A0A1K0FXR2_9BASI|nr:uncharacterized protein UBRO_00393 [Ustilago bromivora]SYW81356.1 uncharacterized protein UBRO2_04226 [Ustilago bromivora]
MKAVAAIVLTTLVSTSLASSHGHTTPRRRHHNKGPVDAEQAIVKRATYSGMATWYDVGTGNAGACGQFLNPNDHVVALNQPMYGDLGQRSSWCGKTIIISNGKKTATARVEDACPTGGGNCFYGSLDMSVGLFTEFTSLGTGVFPITWSPVGEGGGNSGNNGGGNNNDNNNDDDDDGDDDDDDDGQAAAAAAKKKAQQAAKQAKEEAKSQAAAASRSAAAAAAASSAAASRSAASSRASVYSVTKAAARASASVSRVAAKSRASVRASKSAAAASSALSASAASATAATPTGNLNNFANLYDGLSKIIMEQADS